MGYTVGFILVILSRLQLFTENTITVVLPVLKSKSLDILICDARLWGGVFTANIVGTFIVALLSICGGSLVPEYAEGTKAVALHFTQYSAMEAFRYGIPAEFFIAAYNFARRLKTLNGLGTYEYICKIWTSEPDRFIIKPIHQMPGLNT